MEKKQLYSIVTTILAIYGFKHWKQSVWMRLGTEVSDCIYLQRSIYGHFYYFHYGYIINKLPLPSGVFWHTFGKIDIPSSIYKKIRINLDLENNLSDEERERELKHIFQDIVPKENSIDTEKKLKEFLLSEQLLLSKDVMNYLKIKIINGKYEDAKE
jgi:hypothetical protein